MTTEMPTLVTSVTVLHGAVVVEMSGVTDSGPAVMELRSGDAEVLQALARNMLVLAQEQVPVVAGDIRERVADALDGLDYMQLDTGIRTLVRELRRLGFATTDSGDGESKPPAMRDIHEPHVACLVAPDKIVAEAQRLQSALPSGWRVEATYFPLQHDAILLALGGSFEDNNG